MTFLTESRGGWATFCAAISIVKVSPLFSASEFLITAPVAALTKKGPLLELVYLTCLLVELSWSETNHRITSLSVGKSLNTLIVVTPVGSICGLRSFTSSTVMTNSVVVLRELPSVAWINIRISEELS